MRLSRLDLVRYGRFSNHTIELPRSARDIHIIVGPNEAGKSTIRAAIADLLFSFPKSSPYGFAFEQNELRIGAVLEHGASALEFQRKKGNRQTLRSSVDAALPDEALAAYLAGCSRQDFERAFSLDHEKLVEGGRQILSSSSDLGRMLFESASGIASFGKIRDELESEAAALWAPRRSQERAYYRATDEYEQAAKELKQILVRSKDWLDRQREVNELQAALHEARERARGLTDRRTVLERARRSGPNIQKLVDFESKLSALGTTVSLATDAGDILANAEREMHAQRLRATQAKEQEAKAQRGSESIELDSAALDQSRAIADLVTLRERYSTHEADIPRRQAEIDVHWNTATTAAHDLGWTFTGEDQLRDLMPGMAQTSALDELLQSHGAAEKARESASKSVADKQSEIDELRSELDELPESEIPLALQEAVRIARKLGDIDAEKQKRTKELEQGRRALTAAMDRVRPFRGELDALRSLSLPSQQHWQRALTSRQELDAEAKQIELKLAASFDDLQKKNLEIRQHERSTVLVTRESLVTARQVRDGLWKRIKASPESLTAAVEPFEHATLNADQLADTREVTLAAASELQSKVSEKERLELQTELQKRGLDDTRGKAEAALSTWTAAMQDAGTPGVALESFGSFCAARDAALASDEHRENAAESLAELEARVSAASIGLTTSLKEAGLTVPGNASLPQLLDAAAAHIKRIEDRSVRRETQQKALTSASRILKKLSEEAEAARKGYAQWEQDWRSALSGARLAPTCTLALAKESLAAIRNIRAALVEIQKKLDERISPMKQDLERFATTARALAAVVSPDLVNLPAAEVTSRLERRALEATRARDAKSQAEKARDSARGLADEAERSLAVHAAALKPLLQRSGVQEVEELREAIERSDSHRALVSAHAEVERALLEGGDGLSREQLQSELETLRAEFGEGFPARLGPELELLTSGQEEITTEQSDISVRLSAAKKKLEEIAGSEVAATLESKRQDGLAKMGDAVERYVRLATASRVLRWAIERYRETHQGPILKRASSIFAALTLGSFESLFVESDEDPPTLRGKRPNGKDVGVEGMSEGTRDQLYFALRLAALEQRAHEMPFIADDVVINFDDQRARAAFQALGDLSTKTQVLFLTHHEHLLPAIRATVGDDVNIVRV